MALFHTTVVDNQIKALDTIGTASGSIATFDTDKAERLVSCVCEVSSGNSEINVVACGKNVLPKLFTTETKSDVTLTANSDGTLSFSGIASGLEYFIKTFNLKKGSYIFTSGVDESFTTYDTYIAKGGTTIARGGNNMSPNSFTLTEDSTLNILIRIRQGVNTDGLKIYPMIRLSSDSDTTYAEYIGNTYNIQFDETLSGDGAFDVLSGILTRSDNTTKQLDANYIQTNNGTNNIYADTGDIIDLKFVLSVGKAIS